MAIGLQYMNITNVATVGLKQACSRPTTSHANDG